MTSVSAINLPEVVAAVTAAFRDNERALITNELETLDGYFWSSPYTVRFGVAENLYGSQAIAEYRRLCEPVGAGARCKRGCAWRGNGRSSPLTSVSIWAPWTPGDNP